MKSTPLPAIENEKQQIDTFAYLPRHTQSARYQYLSNTQISTLTQQGHVKQACYSW